MRRRRRDLGKDQGRWGLVGDRRWEKNLCCFSLLYLSQLKPGLKGTRQKKGGGCEHALIFHFKTSKYDESSSGKKKEVQKTQQSPCPVTQKQKSPIRPHLSVLTLLLGGGHAGQCDSQKRTVLKYPVRPRMMGGPLWPALGKSSGPAFCAECPWLLWKIPHHLS